MPHQRPRREVAAIEFERAAEVGDGFFVVAAEREIVAWAEREHVWRSARLRTHRQHEKAAAPAMAVISCAAPRARAAVERKGLTDKTARLGSHPVDPRILLREGREFGSLL